MRYLMLLIALMGIQVSPMPAQAADTAATQTIRYLDTTAREDGWGVAIATAVQASRGKKVVIVSYLDPQQTRALFDAAERFMKKSAPPLVVGVIRSPGVQANVTQTEKNPLGFDIFFDGIAVPPPQKFDPRFTRIDELETALRVMQKHYFSRQNR